MPRVRGKCPTDYEWLSALILVLFVFFILPLYLRARVCTAPQFLEERFGRRPRLAFSGFLLITATLIDAPASLYAEAMVAVDTVHSALPNPVAVPTILYVLYHSAHHGHISNRHLLAPGQ